MDALGSGEGMFANASRLPFGPCGFLGRRSARPAAPAEDVVRHGAARSDLAASGEQLPVGVRVRVAGVPLRPACDRVAHSTSAQTPRANCSPAPSATPGRSLRYNRGVFSGLGFVPLVVIFLVAAVVVWFAGIQLSRSTDVLDTRLRLGEALGGAVLLAVATNLPEIAITASAALSHNLGIAIGNILGGIAIQTVVLVVLDVAMGRKRR